MSTCNFEHLDVVSVDAGWGGSDALTKLLLLNPSPGAGIENLSNIGVCFIVHIWVALETNWQWKPYLYQCCAGCRTC